MDTNTLPQSNSELDDQPPLAFGFANELLINPELNSSDLHNCIGLRTERIEAITEMIRFIEEYAEFKHYKSLIEKASYTFDHQVNEIDAFLERIHQLNKEVSHG